MQGKLLIFVCFTTFAALLAAKQQVPAAGRDQQVRSTGGGHHVTSRAELEELRRLRAMLMEQQAELKQQKLDLAEQKKQLVEQQAETEQQKAELEALKREQQTRDVTCRGAMTDYIDRAVTHGKASSVRSDKAVMSGEEYTCRYGVIDMSCPADGLVVVVSATFGLNHNTSQCPGDECCAPDLANDCVEDMSQYKEGEWTDLRLACNYNNNCGFQFDPHLLSTCGEEDQLADYLTITYVCSNDLPSSAQTTPVGFSAYTTSITTYFTGDVISFPLVITNVGGHYSTLTDTFTAPYDGFYMFSVSISSDDDEHLRANLMQDGTLLATAFADDRGAATQDTHHQASMVVVTECTAGDQVWVESEDSGEIHSDTSRISVFTGAMLVQYSDAGPGMTTAIMDEI